MDVGCCYGDEDLALSSDQSTFEGSSYLYDIDLNAKSYLASNAREAMNIGYVYGVKLSANGRMLFQPSMNGIDVFDGRVGNLLTRVSLPIALSQNFDALVSDGIDNVLVAITGQTGSGIAIVDLSSISEPQPLPYIEGGARFDSVPSELSKPDPVGRLSTTSGQHVPVAVTHHRAGPTVSGRR